MKIILLQDEKKLGTEKLCVPQQRKDLVSGILVSDCILYCYMYCKLNQLYLGCSSRNVRTWMALQYRNNRAQRRSIDGGILLRE